jgi:hypothetical protein
MVIDEPTAISIGQPQNQWHQKEHYAHSTDGDKDMTQHASPHVTLGQ